MNATLAALQRSIAVMETLSRVETDLAETLRAIAQDGGEHAAQRLRLADQAAQEAQAAAETAKRMHRQARRLAEILTLHQPGTPVAATVDGPVRDAQRRTREADRLRQNSAARSRQARQLVEVALRKAAMAHDRAADANERAARLGIGDVAERRRRAASHRAAARADRQRAQELRSRVVGCRAVGQ